MQRQQAVISVVVAIAVSLGLLVTGVQAQSGNLEPPGSAVDGTGDPVPTTQTQPSWDQSLPAAERFVRVLPTTATPAGEGVLDKETGLVWEQSPQLGNESWVDARFQCIRRGTGGKMGWRLPSIHELTSLVVRGNPFGDLALPAGHPFSNVQGTRYWSATSDADNPTSVWSVHFGSGSAIATPKTRSNQVWCVHGRGSLSEY